MRQIKKLSKSLDEIPTYSSKATQNTLVTLKTPTGYKNFLLVPEGLGGQFVNEAFLLSVNSQLGQSLINREQGYKFTFNENEYQIISLNPNI